MTLSQLTRVAENFDRRKMEEFQTIFILSLSYIKAQQGYLVDVANQQK